MLRQILSALPRAEPTRNPTVSKLILSHSLTGFPWICVLSALGTWITNLYIDTRMSDPCWAVECLADRCPCGQHPWPRTDSWIVCWLLSIVLAASLAYTPECLRALNKAAHCQRYWIRRLWLPLTLLSYLIERGVNFSPTFRIPVCHNPLVGKHCLDCVLHFMNKESVMQIKKLIFSKINNKLWQIQN